jgi:hypothetical protein
MSRQATAEAASSIPPLIDKYMRMLGLLGEGPVVEVVDNLGSRWLGRTTYKRGLVWIEVQVRATADASTLEKILAHEMAHYAEMTNLSEADVALIKLGRRPVEHGRPFWKFADAINAEMGGDFITEASDQSYELAENTRPFVLVVGFERGRYWWRWAAKRTPAIDAIIDRLCARDGAVVLESTDGQFLSGAKMGKGKIGSSMARSDSDQEAALKEIFEAAGGRA